MKVVDLTGRRFGRLVVQSRQGSSRDQKARWLCLCDCGNASLVAGGTLTRGNTMSCGCFGKDKRLAAHLKHGQSRNPLFQTWFHMRRRCEDPDNIAYRYYGGRGIRVCDRWTKGDGNKTALECFLADMGPKPTPQHSIDRINNDGNYEPSNCRWATAREQAQNCRGHLSPESIDAVLRCFARGEGAKDIAKRFGISASSAYRIRRINVKAA